MKKYSQKIPLAVLLVYLIVNIYLAIFNWEIFSTVLNMNLGFGKVAMIPFVVLFFIGLVLILGLWFFEYRRDLKNQIRFTEDEAKITGLKKDIEIEKLKKQGGNPTTVSHKEEESAPDNPDSYPIDPEGEEDKGRRIKLSNKSKVSSSGKTND